MKLEDLEKGLKQGKLDSLYLFYGEERFLLESCLKKIKNLFGETLKGINYIEIDETNLNEIISDIETPPFGFEKKLIVAKNTGLFKKEAKKKSKKEENSIQAKLLEYLEENFESVKDSIVLVFIEQDIEKSDLASFVDKNGICCNFEYQKANQIQVRIKQITNAYKVNIDVPTLSYFIEVCGTDMQELINEIRKLIEYVGENGTITKQDIDNLSIKKIESVIFDLTDNLAIKKIDVALDILDNLIYQKEAVQKILVTLYNHFKKLYLCTIAIKENRDIVTSLELKPNQTFLVSKYKKQASYFKNDELRIILKELIDLDYNYKNGKIDLDLGLRSILCNYCS
jgi:DNA polymerase-3 subunit delta